MRDRPPTPLHSPAPWHVDPDERPDMEWNNHIYSADSTCVCFMAHSDGKDDERDEANARLIAAAPDLLEALEIVKDMATAMRGEDFNLGYEQWRKVHAAIKKARGE